jgi:hypothetical protein
MRHFHKLVENLDISVLMHQIARQPELWDQNRLRTCHPGTAHSQVSDIWVWFNDVDPKALAAVVDDRETIPYPAWNLLPAVRPILFGLMRQVEGTRLGRVLITRLAPGKEILPHVDGGAPAEYYQRYQIALQSNIGCNFRIENETVNFKTGDVWWINNKAEHAVVNNSCDDRIALIIDIRCF